MSLHKYSIVLLALLALLCSCHDEDKGDIPQSMSEPQILL